MTVGPADVFARVAFYPTLFYTYLMSKMTSRAWYSRVDDWVLVGALPIWPIAKQLVEKENVRGVVSLTMDFETRDFTPTEKEWNAMGVKLLKVATLDFTGTPTQSNIHLAVNFIQDHRKRNESVYVHCKAGRTRSVTVVACYLIQAYGMTPEKAVAFVTAVRPHVWLRDTQMKSVYTFYQSVHR